MKKYTILAFTLVLTATLFTGCRSRSNDATSPTIIPTMPLPTTEATSAPTSEPTTAPTTESTIPSAAPTENGNDPLDETAGEDGFVHSDPTETTGGTEGRARSGMKGQK